MPDKAHKTKNKLSKVLFPIGFKLVTIITILTLLSLGALTMLVSFMVSGDTRIAAEDNNFTVNQRSAAEAATDISTVRSNALVLLETIDAAAGQAFSQRIARYFFERNQDLALVAVSSAEGIFKQDLFFVNNNFFQTREIESSTIDSFIVKRLDEAKRAAAGETLLLNGTPDFGIPLLVLFFPWHDSTAIAIFSAEKLSESFGSGTNISYMINNDGDILVHSDNELVRSGANVANQQFIRAMLKNPEDSVQTLYTDEQNVQYFGAFTKIKTEGAVVITSIEYNKVFEGIAATTRRNTYLTAAVIFLSVLFIWFFSKSISVPLQLLSTAALQIEKGIFEIDLRSKTRDEIGLLTNSFRRMSTALSIFGRFTNKEIAVRAMRGEIKPGGLPKHATIFFSDIRNFTKKCEEFTNQFGDEAPDKIVYWLNDYLESMIDCVEKTGGTIDKFIGDAVMAHWGTASTTGSSEEDAYNCVKAALMMRSVLMEMNKDRKEGDPKNPPIQIGCGINTGMVTAGQIGSKVRMEYTVIGDAVNLASRTESLNKPLGTDILITEDTWDLIGKYLITEEMPPVQVKGKEKPIRLFAVVNIRSPDGKNQKEPVTLAQVRKMLGLETPKKSEMNLGVKEKKYKIGK